MTNVARKLATGAIWMVLAKLVERGLGIVSTLILARLLVPADFGLVAMATSVLALLELIAAFGFDTALIRDQSIGREKYDTAWTMNAILGSVIAAGLVVLALPAASFYEEPRLAPVMAAIGAASLLQGLENIGVVDFRKQLDFRREFLFFGGKKLVAFCVTVPLAWYLRNYWALVIGMIAGRFAGLALSFSVHPFRPRFSLSQLAELIGFSKWLLINNAINFVRTRYADLVIGRLMGPNALGLFNVGAEIAALPSSELVAPINRAAYPAYAQIASDRAALQKEYLSVLGMIALLAVPSAVGLSAVAPVLVPALLGEKWVGAVEVLEILGLLGAISVLVGNSYAVFFALNKPRLQVIIGGAHAVGMVVGLPVFGSMMGLRGILVAMVISYLIMVPFSFYFLIRELSLKTGRIIGVVWRPLSAATGMYTIVSYFISSVAQPADIRPLLAAVALGAFCYIALVLLFWILSARPAGAEATLLAFLRRRTLQWQLPT